MKKTILIFIFFFLFFTGSYSNAEIDLYYFDYITRSDNYNIYSNISDTFNFYIGVAAEDMLDKLTDTFLYNREEEDKSKDIILVFENGDEMQKFIPYIDKISIESLLEGSITKEFNPTANQVYGFNAQLKKFNQPENIVFFVPNINLKPYEEIYNYAPLFQALTEQFFKVYLTTEIPEWMIKGILLAVSDYKKEFVFSLKYRIEKYFCASYERKFWSDMVWVNRYWENGMFTLEEVLDNDPGIDKGNRLYRSYISLLAHFFFFNPYNTSSSSRNLIQKIDDYILTNGQLDGDTAKSFIIDEYGDLNTLEEEIYAYYSPDSVNQQIRQFWKVYNSDYRSNKGSNNIIHMTTQSSYPNQTMPSPLRNIVDGDMDGYYQSQEQLKKGETLIIDTQANILARNILIQFANFAIDPAKETFNGQIPDKARVITSIDGKNWSVWEYFNRNIPIVYLTETDYNAVRYWGFVVDKDMNKPLTINEMWIK